jgi:hypothetical protein
MCLLVVKKVYFVYRCQTTSPPRFSFREGLVFLAHAGLLVFGESVAQMVVIAVAVCTKTGKGMSASCQPPRQRSVVFSVVKFLFSKAPGQQTLQQPCYYSHTAHSHHKNHSIGKLIANCWISACMSPFRRYQPPANGRSHCRIP